MKGPPPKRNLPIPPGIKSEEASSVQVIDDSQYDEPGIPSEMRRYYEGLVSSRRRSRLFNNSNNNNNNNNNNNYEISTSQQLRTTGNGIGRNVRSLGEEQSPSFWDDGTRQMLLQNPETGSYYIPISSGDFFVIFFFFVKRITNKPFSRKKYE
ncbi:unnamed protein product [Thelazia callipaeda]|uniref:Velvet domain-containing protein n=1 Tax=Thelazia callipaeda TaxID=103827 RepID=A0A0N5CWY0_THECL|nr:unnamed protein product [Thelazia callipaeda]